MFGINDTLVLLAIHEADGNQKVASLRNIIALADYVNHAVLTYEEFNGAWKKLFSAGLVGKKETLFYITPVFAEWWTKTFIDPNS